MICANQLLCHVMATQIPEAGGCWKIWNWKYACDAVITLWGEKPNRLLKNVCPWCMLAQKYMCSSYAIRCLKSYSRTCNNEQYPNSPDAASQLCAHTICKSLCHLSTFQQQCLKEDSRTPPPPPFPSVPLSLPPLCLCPWWPSYWVVRLPALTLVLGLT